MKKFVYSASRDTFANYDFEDFNALMIDAGRKTFKGITSNEANDKLREVFNTLLGLDEKSTRKEIRRAIRKHKNEIFEVTEDAIDALIIGGWGDNPFFDEYVEYKSGAYGDTNSWFVPDDTILTVSEVSGGHHDIIRQRLGAGQSFSVKTQWYACKIYTEFELFLAGRVDWAGFVQKIYEAFDQKINSLVFTAFNAAGSVIPNSSQFVKTGTLVKNTLLTLIEDVQAANPGKEIIMMGTKSALAQLDALEDIAWISSSMKEERHTLGRQAIWQGVRLVEIPQVFAPGDTTTKIVNNTKLLVMPVDPANKLIKVYDEGDAMIKEISDGTTNMDMTMEYEYQRKMGLATVFSRYFGMWTVSGS